MYQWGSWEHFGTLVATWLLAHHVLWRLLGLLRDLLLTFMITAHATLRV